ncbi:hypothetical protein SAMN03080615_01634 [Amphritea atlantica]|uniref:Peptidase propeptide and YPEB domain-containing protein n=1 Tax=Amphritea atlantica TaxID=355243 RepID=A0A1H9GEF6_9GAMM|nr:hypothetical protein [Amphritea atlantica]SEQ48466.1 hypothetical protein SAMN03080615_01634 [Amphritea atlantica]
MKKWIVLMMMVVAFPAYATFLNTKDGGRIMRGDSVAEVVSGLGRPLARAFETVCTKERGGHCKQWEAVERWQYIQEDLNWTVTIMGGKVVDTEWHR